MKKRGRPCKEETRKTGYLLKMNDEETVMLDYICEKTGKSKAEIIRKGIRMQYNLLKYSD